MTREPKAQVVMPALTLDGSPIFPSIRLLDGRYDLYHRLGGGISAVVYLGWDRELRREVAIKLLRPELGGSPDHVEQLRREGRRLGRIESERVVPIHDMILGPTAHYLVMRRLAGQTLEQVAARGRRYSPMCALQIAADVLVGLADLHREGVVHRDVKPSNLQIDDDDRATLFDLGIASDGSGAAPTGSGTPRFMSPEHRSSRGTDERSDLYQVGLVLLYAVTGTIGDDHRAAIAALPPNLSAVITRARELDPGRRFQTALEMHRTVMQAWRDSATIDLELDRSDLVDATIDRARATPRPRRSHWYGVAIAIALAVAVGFVSLTRPDPTVAAASMVEAAPAILDAEMPIESRSLASREPAPGVRTPAAQVVVRATEPEGEIAPSRPTGRPPPTTAADYLANATASERNGAEDDAIAAYRRYVHLAGADVPAWVTARLSNLEARR